MKLDFHLDAYKIYLDLIKTNYKIIKFEDYFSKNNIPKNFCIIRHDVDRKPDFALEMANIGVRKMENARDKQQQYLNKVEEKLKLSKALIFSITLIPCNRFWNPNDMYLECRSLSLFSFLPLYRRLPYIVFAPNENIKLLWV